MPWSPNISDGKTLPNGEWYSLQKRRNIPRRIRCYGSAFAYLSYITQGEWDLIVATSPKNSKLQLTKWDVYFYGLNTRFSEASGEIVGQCPLYWRSEPQHAIARLIYLTEQQIKILKSIDIHGSGVGTKNNYGPARIPSYQGDGGGGGGGDSGGDSSDAYDDSAYTNASPPKPIKKAIDVINEEIAELTKGESKLYEGTLSSLGTMVSQGINDASPKVTIENGGGLLEEGEKVSLTYFEQQEAIVGKPITGKVSAVSTGFIRQYWLDPTYSVFGSDTAIPAITGSIPNPFTLKDGTIVVNFTGSFLYYIDLQMQRACGADFVNIDHFIAVIRQLQATLTTNNRLVVAANNAKENPELYGSSTLTGILTQNLEKFKSSPTLKILFNNIGRLAGNLTDGEFRNGEWIGFGTANAVIKTLVDNNFADIQINGRTLADTIEFSGIDYQDIWNPDYTSRFENILKLIIDRNVLTSIQEVLQTNVVNIASAYDFTIYEKFSGGTNDSQFKTLRDLGKEFSINYSSLNVATGKEISTMLDGVQVPDNPNSIEIIKGENSTLDLNLIESIKLKLITDEDGGPASVLDILGSVAGCITEPMKKVNEGISEIYRDPTYGYQIRDLLTEISRMSGKIPLTAEEEIQGESSLDFWQRELEQKKSEYKSLIKTVSEYAPLKQAVEKVNSNYLTCCRQIYREHKNWNKARLGAIEPVDAAGRASFILDIPSFGEDAEGLGIGRLLCGMAQSNDGGDRVKASLGGGKTDAAAILVGIERRNTL